MTEAGWFTSDDPTPMLEAVWDTVSCRRVRLFLLACCRRHPGLFPDPRSAAAIVYAERDVDGHGTEPERSALQGAALEAQFDSPGAAGDYLLAPAVLLTVELVPVLADESARSVAEAAARAADDPGAVTGLRADQADLLRDILGNPFRPMTPDPSWLTPTVLALASAIYADRAFDRLPILADALEEAGCDNDDVLLHCRGDGPHVRGCWVVDLVLGKE